MTLVSKRLRGKQLFEVSAHHEHRSDFLAGVFDFCRQRSNYWVLTGDSHRLSLAFSHLLRESAVCGTVAVAAH